MKDTLNLEKPVEIEGIEAGIRRLRQLREDCQRDIEKHGDSAAIMLYVKGKWGKKNTKRLYKGGPKGNIVADGFEKFTGMVLVRFSAKEIVDDLDKLLRSVPQAAVEV